ncbi:hypothetical protein [Microbacterium esteraromaticum]|uniref:hypothetical protein n=1 Tax=Microbacterium esteraromaticum TaxID=57043 RepID=UPI0019D409D2|nr:hypothetical protein [Microbacterium esteraromaticum]MBN7792538.1 hypothetical protein [Microbacterium esteraromaticum]
MRAFRLVLGGVLAASLVAVGIRGAILTHQAWLPCAAGSSVEACAAAMDGPEHLAALASLWGLALVLTITAAFVLRTRPARVLGISATVLVLLMNSITEYALALGFVGGHHDVPPGTGYGQASAWILAGVLVGTGTLADARTPHAPVAPFDRTQPMPVRSIRHIATRARRNRSVT